MPKQDNPLETDETRVMGIPSAQWLRMTDSQQREYAEVFQARWMQIIQRHGDGTTTLDQYERELSKLWQVPPALFRKGRCVEHFAPELMKPVRDGTLSMQDAWNVATRRMRKQQRG